MKSVGLGVRALTCLVTSAALASLAIGCGGNIAFDADRADAAPDPSPRETPDAATIELPDASSPPVLPDASPHSVPDSGTRSPGDWIVFDSNRDGMQHIWAVHPDGSALHRIETSQAASQPAISADARFIAFVAGAGDIEVLDLDTNVTQAIAGSSGGASPAFSPDGSQLAFALGGDIEAVATANQFSAMPTVITLGAHPTFAPDGSLVADRMNSIVEVHGGQVTEIVPNTTTTMAEPAISPDGSEIAFTVFCGDGLTSVWTASLGAPIRACIDGTRQSSSLEGSSYHPSWGPNATLVYALDQQGIYTHVIGGDSTDGVVLGDAHDPVWAPANAAL
jgi:Tol biopolymer transport system component